MKQLDLDRLHKVASTNHPARGSGRTVFFAYQIIGIAQTGVYNFYPDNKPIYIIFNKPSRVVEASILKICEILKFENIPFKLNKSYSLQVYETVFVFVKIENSEDVTGKDACYLWHHSDLCWDLQVDDIDYITKVTINSSLIKGIELWQQ